MNDWWLYDDVGCSQVSNVEDVAEVFGKVEDLKMSNVEDDSVDEVDDVSVENHDDRLG